LSRFAHQQEIFYIRNFLSFSNRVFYELSRWVRALYEAMEPLDHFSDDELIRLWAHEALRLFHDRLISETRKRNGAIVMLI
jgi:hypothetical protein